MQEDYLKLAKMSLSQAFLIVCSFCLISFGQPAWSEWCGMAAAAFGYAMFWLVLLECPIPKHRFWLSTAWFSGVQLIQLSWGISHPFFYIYFVYFLYAFLLGAQFGVVGLLITKANVSKATGLLGIAGLWTLLEWSRLFVFSGNPWNPSGLALSSSIYSLQFASIGGIYFLSFWVVLVNLLALQIWIFQDQFKTKFLIWAFAAMLPYVFGLFQLTFHEELMARRTQDKNAFSVVLVQTAFPVEESLPGWERKQMVLYVLDEWKKILNIVKPHEGKKIDLMVLPEMIVPFGTYSMMYPYEIVKKSFQEAFGFDVIKKLPPLKSPLARKIDTVNGPIWIVNNAYWVQSLANIFQTGIVAGLEDANDDEFGKREYYSAAQYFQPLAQVGFEGDLPLIQRYEKRVLVPMGEYIPFDFLRNLAAEYGIQGSFTPGKEAKIFNCGQILFGISICYEETLGHLMRENRLKGGELLVNLTSDVWFPDSRLPKQHFDHARLRTVENGMPLIRACNTGVTAVLDSLGRSVAVLGDGDANQQWLADSIYVKVPTYTYHTLYSQWGDMMIIGFSAFFLLFIPGIFQKWI